MVKNALKMIYVLFQGLKDLLISPLRNLSFHGELIKMRFHLRLLGIQYFNNMSIRLVGKQLR